MTKSLKRLKEKKEQLKEEKEGLEKEIEEMRALKSQLQGMQNVQIFKWPGFSVELHGVSRNLSFTSYLVCLSKLIITNGCQVLAYFTKMWIFSYSFSCILQDC